MTLASVSCMLYVRNSSMLRALLRA
jgi:hypothetical protein